MVMPNKLHLMDSGKSVMMPTKKFIKETKTLIKLLDKCGEKKESMKQKKNLAVATQGKEMASMSMTKGLMYGG